MLSRETQTCPIAAPLHMWALYWHLGGVYFSTLFPRFSLSVSMCVCVCGNFYIEIYHAKNITKKI